MVGSGDGGKYKTVRTVQYIATRKMETGEKIQAAKIGWAKKGKTPTSTMYIGITLGAYLSMSLVRSSAKSTCGEQMVVRGM